LTNDKKGAWDKKVDIYTNTFHFSDFIPFSALTLLNGERKSIWPLKAAPIIRKVPVSENLIHPGVTPPKNQLNKKLSVSDAVEIRTVI